MVKFYDPNNSVRDSLGGFKPKEYTISKTSAVNHDFSGMVITRVPDGMHFKGAVFDDDTLRVTHSYLSVFA
ncbi:MAG: hypothetical protein GY804_04805 [Alphaproteobacteria bacterium]|nr:hypothetical protein [Alphaproteobacteria bacterium]